MPAYTKSYPVWKDDPDHTTPITAAKLDNMDGGIDTAHAAIDTHAAASPAHAASAIAVTPTGGIAATNAQAALQELQAEIITGAGLLPAAIIDAKGDLIAGSAPDAAARLPVGLVGQVLLADPTQPLGMKWSSAIGGGGAIEYENLWNDTEIYSAGDVVYHNGIQYLAVNPSQGDEPAAFTSSSLYVPVDAVTVAGTRLVSTKLLSADTQPAFRIMGDGKLEWGGGGAAAPDTTLYRNGVGTLRTDGAFSVGKGVYAGSAEGLGGWAFYSNLSGDANVRFTLSNIGLMQWGAGAAAPDTNLYRSAVGVLKTDGSLTVGNQLIVEAASHGIYLPNIPAAFSALLTKAAADAQYRFRILGTGELKWGPGGSTLEDTNLYRKAANLLGTDDSFRAGADLVANTNADGTWTVNSVAIGHTGGGYGPYIVFGSGADVNLYRSAANLLQTDDDFRVGPGVGRVTFTKDGVGGDILIGADVNLYRASADALKTDDSLIIGRNVGASLSALHLNINGTTFQVYIGPADSAGAGYRSLRVFN